MNIGKLVRITKHLLKLLISVSIIVYLFSKVDISAVLERMKTANFLLVFLATSLIFALVVPQAIRWRKILIILGAQLKFRLALGTTMVGWFFNQVLPSSVGGDAFRIWYAYRFGIRLAIATQSVIFDRVSALIAVMLILLFSSPWLNVFFTSNQPVLTVVLFATVLLIVCILLLVSDYLIPPFLPNTLKNKIVEFVRTTRSVFLGRNGLKVIAISVAIHMTIAFAVWLLAQSMQIQLNIMHVLLLMPLILFVSSIPISIAGWGVRESSMVVVFGMVGVPTEAAMSISLSFGLAMLVASIPGGIVWWLMHHEVPETD
jgi:uncharacterized membrane protein YbhN (UPF0104 family)